MATDPRRIPLAAPLTGAEEWEALRAPLESGRLTEGGLVAQFERRFAERHGVSHAIAVSSGTSALHLAVLALDLQPGDEVVVPAFSWVAVANAVALTGATPVFADVDPCTYNVTPEGLDAVRSSRTRALVPVHQFGLCADVDTLRSVLTPDAEVIEDAACAAGASMADAPAGSLGRFGCFSFHPRKVLTTGEGGMVTTSDDVSAARVRQLRNHGLSPVAVIDGGMADVIEVGLNYRLSELHAAVGLTQLAKLDSMIDGRARLAQRYFDALAGLEWLRLPARPEGFRHVWQSFVVVVGGSVDRAAVVADLAARRIDTRPGTHSICELAVYRRRFGANPATVPVSSELHRQSLALPLHNRMSDGDADQVIDALLHLRPRLGP